jgi:uncharacterized cupin superfamily protein
MRPLPPGFKPRPRLIPDMGYEVVDVDALPTTPDRPSAQRRVSAAAGLSNVAVNRFDVAPGEQAPLAYHYHDEQEEVFYVLAGTLHVETPEGEFVVEADEAFAATPGSPHRAFNPASASGDVRVLAIGAPAVDDAEAYDPED